MNVALIGCGYVADFYMAALPNQPQLVVVGAYDRNQSRLERFGAHHGIPVYPDYDAVLADPNVDIVLNLTNPRSHFEVSRRALEAGKHVYSEKPLAMDFQDGKDLIDLARQNGVVIASAPCTVLGEAAQTLWKALRNDKIGVPRLVYAELSDGPIPLMKTDTWRNESGAPWPVKDELEVGCTIEHAGYALTWLTTFFGPVSRVSVFGGHVMHDSPVPVDYATPDLSIGMLEFQSGLIARVTCDIYASHDHRFRVFGDSGVLTVPECWDMGSPVYFTSRSERELEHGLQLEKVGFDSWAPWARPTKLPLVRKANFAYGGSPDVHRIDFFRGVAELAASVQEHRPCRLGGEWALHVLELVLAMAVRTPGTKCFEMESTFEPIEPMAWAGE